jgi:hypothetical protein
MKKMKRGGVPFAVVALVLILGVSLAYAEPRWIQLSPAGEGAVIKKAVAAKAPSITMKDQGPDRATVSSVWQIQN